MNIIIFEDKNNGFLAPFSINHSSIEIRVGAFTNFDRIKSMYPNSKFILIVNDILIFGEFFSRWKHFNT